MTDLKDNVKVCFYVYAELRDYDGEEVNRWSFDASLSRSDVDLLLTSRFVRELSRSFERYAERHLVFEGGASTLGWHSYEAPIESVPMFVGQLRGWFVGLGYSCGEVQYERLES
ncbi:MAG: hypothetical protein ACODAB_09770 [Gemmatimonadota bacterium]